MERSVNIEQPEVVKLYQIATPLMSCAKHRLFLGNRRRGFCSGRSPTSRFCTRCSAYLQVSLVLQIELAESDWRNSFFIHSILQWPSSTAENLSVEPYILNDIDWLRNYQKCKLERAQTPKKYWSEKWSVDKQRQTMTCRLSWTVIGTTLSGNSPSLLHPGNLTCTSSRYLKNKEPRNKKQRNKPKPHLCLSV